MQNFLGNLCHLRISNWDLPSTNFEHPIFLSVQVTCKAIAVPSASAFEVLSGRTASDSCKTTYCPKLCACCFLDNFFEARNFRNSSGFWTKSSENEQRFANCRAVRARDWESKNQIYMYFHGLFNFWIFKFNSNAVGFLVWLIF